MEISLSVRYSMRKSGRVLCFKHAVIEAMKGTDIEVEVDEFGLSGNDMRDLVCGQCIDEE